MICQWKRSWKKDQSSLNPRALKKYIFSWSTFIFVAVKILVHTICSLMLGFPTFSSIAAATKRKTWSARDHLDWLTRGLKTNPTTTLTHWFLWHSILHDTTKIQLSICSFLGFFFNFYYYFYSFQTWPKWTRTYVNAQSCRLAFNDLVKSLARFHVETVTRSMASWTDSWNVSRSPTLMRRLQEVPGICDPGVDWFNQTG